MRNIKTCFTPLNVYNPYARNVVKIINGLGYDVISLSELFKNPKNLFCCKIVNLNWFENINNKKDYYQRMIILNIIKILKKRIIYTLHNRVPHNKVLHNKDDEITKYSKRLMRKLCKDASVIVGLCTETEDVVKELNPEMLSKIVIIKHPNYIGNYDLSGKGNLREKYKIEKEKKVMLFFGAVSPYKNISILIDCFLELRSENFVLIIAGKPSDTEYAKRIIEKCKDKENIYLDLRYIPDEEVELFYNTADIVALPYDKTSSLNSGAVYLSFSLKKTVICPNIGTINDLEDQSFIYSYSYESSEDHKGMLLSAMINMKNEVSKRPEILKEYGEKAFQYVKTVHSNQLIKDQYDALYNKLYELK